MDWIKLSEPELEAGILHDFEIALRNKEVGYTGGYIESFKNQIRCFLGSPNIGLFASGTASIHLALKLADVNPQDEVICQSLTFAASANPVLYLGAKPVFVGSEACTWNMCPRQLERALLDRKRKGKVVKAIIPVHLYGMPANMKELEAVAKQFNVPIIEDSAEALGSEIEGRKCGTFGDFGVLSFNANKIITTGGGGAIIAKDRAHIERANFLALQAKDPAPHYQHSQLGYNYAFSNLNAVLGNAQFGKLDEKIKKRRSNFQHYKERLGTFEEIGFQHGVDESRSNRWLTSILLPNKRSCLELKQFLESRQIETRPVWKPMHLQPLYAEFPYYGDRIEEKIFDHGMCLPSGSGLTEDQLGLVSDTIRIFLKKEAKKGNVYKDF